MNSFGTGYFPPTDPRTKDWFLVNNKMFLVTTLFSYVYIVKVGGPRFMKHRKPFDNLKPLILFYNAAMVLLNVFFGTSFLLKTYLGGGYNIVCQGIDFNVRDEATMSLLNLEWWYVLVRIGDFLDTVFFVLRKKDSHVSFLHVSHHVMVVFMYWYGVGHGGDGHAVFSIAVNCFVHVLMYSYYSLSLLGPSVRPYLWWKRYLTQVQIVQFVLIIAHTAIPLFRDCGYPKVLVLIGVPQVLLILFLFVNFYFKAYQAQRAHREGDCIKNKSS